MKLYFFFLVLSYKKKKSSITYDEIDFFKSRDKKVLNKKNR